uniref:Ileal sodium/bile acid cotransporter n=1 Tax=Strigamia maritima TaxID=126957 RepID=T1II40_STRMM
MELSIFTFIFASHEPRMNNFTFPNSSFVLNLTVELTTIVGDHEEALKIALEVLLVALLAFVMLAMGCDITWSDLWIHLRRPIGVIIGMTSQFGILPLCAFIISKSLHLTVFESLSLLILSCCPGGVVSNLFTMWCNGNVSLSICMTTMSTMMALAMMPLNLLMYSQMWDSSEDQVVVPYDKLATTLVTIFIPVVVGVTIKTKCPKAAKWVIRPRMNNFTFPNSSFVLNLTVELTTRYTIVGDHEEALKIALEVLLVALLAFVMLAMGCDITWSDLWIHLRRPIGIIIGMTSQFGVLPLCAFIISRSLHLTIFESLSLLILSCCPGGVVSNLFTMWCNGNVSLSICMTTMSTMMALAMMPLNILLYTQTWDSSEDQVVVPYDKLATTLVTIFIPVVVGVTIKTKCPKAAKWVIRSGTTAGFLSIIGSIVIQAILIPGLFNCSWKSYFSAFILPILGFSFGFIWARVFKMSYKDARTVAFETGSQNVPLALTIILLSFPFDKQKEMAPIPLLFAIFIHIEAIIGCLLYWWWKNQKKLHAEKKEKPEAETRENEKMLVEHKERSLELI